MTLRGNSLRCDSQSTGGKWKQSVQIRTSLLQNSEDTRRTGKYLAKPMSARAVQSPTATGHTLWAIHSHQSLPLPSLF